MALTSKSTDDSITSSTVDSSTKVAELIKKNASDATTTSSSFFSRFLNTLPITGILGQNPALAKSLLSEYNKYYKSITNETNAIIPPPGTENLVIELNPNRITQPLDNVLNNFINTQYHMILSMIPETSMYDVQSDIKRISEESTSIDTLKKEVRKSGTVTIASTGEVFRNSQYDLSLLSNIDSIKNLSSDSSVFKLITGALGFNFTPQVLSQYLKLFKNYTDEDIKKLTTKTYDRTSSNYYNIESLHLSNITAPSRLNPNIGEMVSMSMKLIEPHGFNLKDDLLNTSKALGYDGINVGRVVYRIDIFFSGFNPTTGQWVEQIELGKNVDGTVLKTISYFVSIANIKARLSTKGTEYDITLVPASHYGYRPEVMITDSSNIYSGDAATLGGYLSSLAQILENNVANRTGNQIKRKYEFYGPKYIMHANIDAADFNKRYMLKAGNNKGMVSHIGKEIDILSILSEMLSTIAGVQEAFLVSKNPNDSFLQPRVLWKIRFNVKYGQKPDSGANRLNDYNLITYQYYIEPFLTFFKGTMTPENSKVYMDPQVQAERVRAILNYGMLIKEYKYLYTSENTDVIDVDLEFNTFYYQTIDKNQDTPDRKGTASPKTGSTISDENKDKDTNNPNIVLPKTKSDLTSKKISANSLLNDKDRFGGGFGEIADNQMFLNKADSITISRQKYKLYFDDHIKNDLLILKPLKVKGDPLWLTSSYMIGSNPLYPIKPLDVVSATSSKAPSATSKTATIANTVDGYILPTIGKIILLNMKAPNQNDYMNPNRTDISSNPNIIGGFYEVLKIDSVFEGGKFTQDITASKLHHLTYAEDYFYNKNTSAPTNGNKTPSSNNKTSSTDSDLSQKTSSTTDANPKFVNPLDGESYRVSSEYGLRTHPITGVQDSHTGIDLAAAKGTPVGAAMDGYVESIKTTELGGNQISIRHDGGYVTTYLHLDSVSPNLQVGDAIPQGYQIGTVGTTGRSTGPHLHLSVYKDGQLINPRQIFQFK